MRIKHYLLAGVMALLVISTGSTMKNEEGDLVTAWKKVDSLENQGLYRSAHAEVIQIYRIARLHADQPNEIKALIYQMKYQRELSEDGRTAALLEMHRYLPENRPVMAALKNSMLAELYYRYYSVNRWEIMQNPTESESSVQTSGSLEMLKKWSPEQFFQTILSLYAQSLNDPEILLNTPVSSFSDLFTGSLADTVNQPTLYDVLVKRAVDFSTNLHEFPIFRVKPAVLCQKTLLGSADEFIRAVKREKDDSANPWMQTLQWYANWLECHMAFKNTDNEVVNSARPALLMADLSRLKFVRDHTCHPDVDSLYRCALINLAKPLEQDSLQARVFLELGRFHATRSERFIPNQEDTSKYKQDRREAVSWLEKAMRWSSTMDGKESSNLRNNLLKPVIRSEVPQVQLPEQSLPVSLWYQNAKEVFYEVYAYSALNYYSNWNKLQPEERLQVLSQLNPLRTGHHQLPDDGDLNPHIVNVILDPLPAGFYLLLWSVNDLVTGKLATTTVTPVALSRISWVSRTDDFGGREFYFRDLESGAAVSSVSVIPWYQIWDDHSRQTRLESGTGLFAAKDGFLRIPAGAPGQNDPARRAYRIAVVAGLDTLISQELFHPGYGQPGRKVQTRATIHTDRSLYKPGQNLHYRGVLIDHYRDSLAIHQTDSIKVTLQNVRYEAVETITVPVDEFGCFTGLFQLPLKGLTGRYFVNTSYGQATVNMEQYRRPGFYFRIDPDHQYYQEGDQISVSGSLIALSGEPVPDAEIAVEVEIQAGVHPLRWSPWAGQRIRVHTEKIKGTSDGRFHWSWMTLPANRNPYSPGGVSSYQIILRATDPNGETQVENLLINCGRESLRYILNIPTGIKVTDTLRIDVEASATDGRSLAVNGLLRIEKLKIPKIRYLPSLLTPPDRFLYSLDEWQKCQKGVPYAQEHRMEHWMTEKILYDANIRIDSAYTLRLPPVGKTEAGWYRASLSSAEPYAEQEPVVRYYYLEPKKLTRIPVGQTLWVKPSSQQLKVGDQFHLSLAFPEKTFCLVEIRLLNETLTSKWLEVGSKTVTLTWPVTSAWQGGAHVRFVGIRDGRSFSKDFNINVPWVNKQITITGLEVPEKVEPGDTIKLNIKLLDENGSPVSGLMGVAIYDASLDQLALHNWNRVAWPGVSVRPSWETTLNRTIGSETLYDKQIDWVWIGQSNPLVFNWFGMGYYGISRQGQTMMLKSTAPQRTPGRIAESVKNFQDQAAGNAAVEEDASLPSNEVDQPQDRTPALVQIRSDFRETALFNGVVKTDEEGRAKVKFTVPEVFTKWKVLAAAHDQQLAIGYYSGAFVSAKDLMIRSNFPPFLRRGDTVDLAARVGWYGQGTISTSTNLTLTGPSGSQSQQYETLDATISSGVSVPYYWRYTPDINDGTAIRYSLVTQSDNQDDGLTDTISIYPDQVELWNSTPFYFNAPGSKTLSVEGRPLEALMEITSTPVWQVIQSMPEVISRERECSEYWFSRFYLANLTGYVAARFPDIAAWFRNEPVEVILDSLSHPLLRNVDIKGTQWESTIWSPQRKTEEARIRQLKEWMDPEKLTREIEYSFEKLSELQRPDGTWPWYKGMGPDWFITQQILAGFGELRAWQVMDISRVQRGNSMIGKAVEAMDSWLNRQFQDLSRVDSTLQQEVQLNPLVINYLYTRAYYVGMSQSALNEIAYLYFIDRIGEEWVKHEAPLQVLMAITHAQIGRMKEASAIYRSIRERMVSSPEMGLYWPRRGYASAWYHWDIWMQSRLIELFAAVEEGRGELDQLRLYLLHQKRGRDWGNGMVASWAAKSLLFYGSPLLQQPASIGFQWGKEQFSPLRVKTGSVAPNGYYRYGWKNQEEMSDAENLEVIHEGGGPAWGAFYTLRDYQLNELAATDGPLKIDRTLMIRNAEGEWTDYQSNTDATVGQVVRVRLTISSDRDLSYLELKDFLGTGFVPVGVLSGYHYQQGLSWYQAREPEAVLFYLHALPRGVHVIEYQAVIEQSGHYFGGYATLQSLYAPEFRAWSDGVRLSATR